MIQHVSLEILREQASREVAFWKLLGFAEAAPPPSLADRAAFVGSGGFQIHLLFAAEPEIPRAAHVAVVVDGYDAVAAALLAAGHGHEPRQQHWGAARGYTRSPAGHRVELMAAPPP